MAHNNRAAFISLMGAAFFWSLSGIFIYYLNSSMGPLAQSAARYGSAGIALFIISFIAFRKEMIIREITVLKYIALAGFLGFIFQMFWVYSLYFIKPGTASLLGEFGTLISLILFCIVDKS
ncbi:MAG: EamA family transporter, partial [Fibrobacteres bacterium]|nr:EamA family transporter [Fibrobacterota bacterium]